MKYPFLAFDIDGTVIDSSEGIVAAMQFALQENGYDTIAASAIQEAVGLALMPMVVSLVPQAVTAQAEEIARAFRVYFSEKGVLQAKLYDGITDALDRLTASGRKLYAVTSKPEPFVMRISEHLHFQHYFISVHAPDLGLAPKKKSELLGEMMKTCNAKPDDVLMIGDRAGDIEAANANQAPALGVSYGFGSIEELQQAGAMQVVHAPSEISAFILND